MKKYLYLLLFILTLNTFSIAKSSEPCTTTMTSSYFTFMSGNTNCSLVWSTDLTGGALVLNFGGSTPYIHEIINYSLQTMSTEAIYNVGLIDNIFNAGTLKGNPAIGNFGGAVITSITNTGKLEGRRSHADIDIRNYGTIGELNNLQGFLTSDPLTYYESLPTNYNIIINSAFDFGQINFSSPSLSTTFGISSLTGTSIGAAGTRYQNVISGLASTSITNEDTLLTYINGLTIATYKLVEDDLSAANTWDLLILSMTGGGPSSFDTQSSMQYQSRQLRSAFNTQTVAANFALNYDCTLFDVKGMCISAGGRYTTIDNPNINNSAAVVTLGYKVNPNIRIGGYLDQNINISHPTGIDVSNNTPLMGAYAVWNKEQSGLGYQLRLANTYQDKDVTSTRTVFNTSEAGSGKSSLTSQSYLAELSYAFQYEDRTLVRPYFGLRYTHLKQDGYTEATTDAVQDPLTVAALRDKSATALLGVKVQRSLTDKATLTAQLGLEQDVHHKVGNYSAADTVGSDLTAITFNSNIKRTRPVASIGAFYDVTKTQRASATINYQQTPFQSTGSATAYVNYMIGF